MAVRVNRATVEWITGKQSKFGCGAVDCFSCYPLQYGCDECGQDFSLPVLMTRPHRLHLCVDCYWEGEVLVP